MASYQSAVLADEPTSWWRLADSTTTIADAQGANALTAAGTYTQAEASLLAGDKNKATLFNGGYAAGGGVYNPPACTWECLVKPASVPGSGTYARLMGFCEGEAGTIDDFEVAIGDGGFLQLYTNFDFYSTFDDTAIAAGDVYHVVATADNATRTVCLYLDGQLVASGIDEHYTGFTTANLLIAGTSSVYTHTLDGVLDEVAFYEHALTADRVAAHYEASITGVGVGLWLPFLTSAAAITAPSSLVDVPKAPAGPATPAGGWEAVWADVFAKLGTAGASFGPNRDPRLMNTGPMAGTAGLRPGFSAINEVEVFANTQATINRNGLNLTAVYDPGKYGTNTDGDPIDYRSGCVWSSPVTSEGGAPGWPDIEGFLYNPIGTGTKTVFETLMRVPFDSNTWGSDAAFWASDGPGQIEFDFAEFAAILDGFTTGGSAIWAAINHVSGAPPAEEFAFGAAPSNIPVFMLDGGWHRYTTEIDDAAKTVDAWVDGNHLDAFPFSYSGLGSLSTNKMGVYFQYAFRNNGGAQKPTFLDSRTMVVRSVAAYQPTGSAGAGIASLSGAWSAPLIQTGVLLV